ncbi:MAG: glycosyltransferase 87 family protein [Planctomycetota bacterium]
MADEPVISDPEPPSGLTTVSLTARLAHRPTLTALTVMGWALLACFVAYCAWSGGIGNNPRGFQIVYVIGYLGYGCLLWVSFFHSDAISKWQVRRWLILCIVMRIFLIPAAPSDDVYRYVWEGRIQNAGFNPFVHAPDDVQLQSLRDDLWPRINHPDYPAIYPPLAQLQFRLVTGLSESVRVMKSVHVAWDLLTMLVIASCLRRVGCAPHRMIVYGACPLVLTAFGIEGHVDSLMLFAVALAWRAAVGGRHELAGAAIGAGIAVKFFPCVLLPWFFTRSHRAVLIALAVVGLLYLPFSDAGRHLFESFNRFAVGGSFFSLPGSLINFPYDERAANLALAVGVGVALVVLAFRRLSFHDYGRAAGTCMLMTMPVFHFWYAALVWLFLPARISVAWIVTGLVLVTYFEADHVMNMTGSWAMPTWVPRAVWMTFMVAMTLQYIATRMIRASRTLRRDLP